MVERIQGFHNPGFSQTNEPLPAQPDEGLRFQRGGGIIEMTAHKTSELLDVGEIKCLEALAWLFGKGADENRITSSTDGQSKPSPPTLRRY